LGSTLIIYFFAGIYLAGFILYASAFIFERLQTEKKSLVILLILIPFIAFTVSNGTIVRVAMQAIGIRHINTPIELSHTNMQQVKALAALYDFKIATCPLKFDDRQLILNGNILWNGIGNKSLIELTKKAYEDEDGKLILSIEVDAAGIWPVRGKNLPPCIDQKTVKPEETKESSSHQPKQENAN
jgi:hypothetical protein